LENKLTLGVEFDQSKVEQGIDKLQKKFNSAFNEMESSIKKLDLLNKKIEEINQKEAEGVKLTQQQKIHRDALVNQSAVLADRIQELRERTERFGAELDQARLDPQSFAEANGYLKESADNANKVSESTKKIKPAADDAARGMKNISDNAGGIKSRIEQGSSSLAGFGNKMLNLAKRVFVFSVITAALRKVRDAISGAIGSNDQLSSSFAMLKNNLAVALQPVLERLVPVIQRVVDKLILASEYLAVFIHALTGADLNKSISDAAKRQRDMADSTDKATKAFEAQIKAIDKQIKAYQKQVKELNKQNKALKKEMEAQLKPLNDQKKALNDQIAAIQKYINELKKQEKAENKIIDAQKSYIQDQINLLKEQKAILIEAQKARQQQVQAERKAISDEIAALNKQIKAIQKLRKARADELKENQKYMASFDTLNVLQTPEETDAQLLAYDKEIAALEEQIELLDERRDAIQDVPDDPMIEQIEKQIAALEAQRDAIERVDYSHLIEAQQELIESIREQIEKLDKMGEKITFEYEAKIEINTEAIEKLGEKIDALQEKKSAFQELAAEAKNNPIKVETSFEESENSIELFKRKIEEFKQKLIDNFGSIEGAATALAVGIGVVMALIGLAFGSPILIIAGLMLAMGALVAYWKSQGKILGADFEDLTNNLRAIFGGFIDFLAGVFTNDWERAFHGLGNIFKGFLNNTLMAVTMWRNTLKSAIKALLQEVANLWFRFIGLFSDDAAEKFAATSGRLLDAVFVEKEYIPLFNLSSFDGGAVSTLHSNPIANGQVVPHSGGGASFGGTALGTDASAQIAALTDAVNRLVQQGGGTTTIEFTGDLAQLARVLNPVIKDENQRASAFA